LGAGNGQLEGIAREYLLRSNGTTPEIQLTEVKEGADFYVARFVQTKNGLAVYDSRALVLISKDGLTAVDAVTNFKNVTSVVNSRIGGQTVLDTATAAIAEKVTPRGSPSMQKAICTYDAPGVQLSSGERVMLPGDTPGSIGRECWQVTIPALDPLGDWLVLVDGPTGRVVSKEDLIMYDSGDGWVYRYSNPIQTGGDLVWPAPDDSDHAILTQQETNGTSWPAVQLLHLNSGTGKLSGSYVDLTAPGIIGGYKPAGLADEVTRQYHYTRANDRFEEVMVYYYVDSVHSYLQLIGETSLLNYPVPAHAHYFDGANAFYDPSDGGLHFGDGSDDYPIDTAEDADVIIHEYGHAIHGDQGLLNGWVSEEMYAFSEGFSDYLAASFLDQGASGTEGCLSEWFGYGLSYDHISDIQTGTYPYCMRDTFSTKHYPEDMIGEVHADGEIWSAALWQLRGLLGKATTDFLAVETGYYLWPSASLRDAAKAMIQVDRVVYGGAHESTIRQVFYDDGILMYRITSTVYPRNMRESPINIPIENRGFERGTFAPEWRTIGSPTPQIVRSPVYAGSYAAKLLHSNAYVVTETAIYYEFTLPSDASWVRLTFHYRIDTVDWMPYDWFEWRLGTEGSWWYSRWLYDTGGRFYGASYDLPVWFLQGQICRLTFLLHDDGWIDFPTYVYVDSDVYVDGLSWSNFHAPVTVNGTTMDTPSYPWFDTIIQDGQSISASVPSPVVTLGGGYEYHFTGWSDGELNPVHPVFTPSDDLWLIAEYADRLAIPLHAGWNLVSLPLIQDNPSITSVLRYQIASNEIAIVWSYTGMPRAWRYFIPGKASTLSTVVDGDAYWIYTRAADTLYVEGNVIAPVRTPPSYSLAAGWNLVGFKPQPIITAGTVGEYLFSIAGYYDPNNVWVLDNSSGNWIRATNSTVLEPGQAMWILMTRSATLRP
jgi:Zn-dependent metalloprotease